MEQKKSFKRYFRNFSTFRSLLWKIIGSISKLKLILKGVNLGKDVVISYKAHFDGAGARRISVGDNTWVLAHSIILAHDRCRKFKATTRIGKDCIIGIGSMVMPGITIGNEVIVAAGAVVTRNVPSNCIVAGNPAKIIRVY